MDIFKEFSTDEDKEVEGVWQAIGDGVELLVARAGNRKYSRLLAREVEKHQRQLDMKNDAADALSDSIMIDVMSQTVLLGWRGVLEFKGETLSYSVDNAKKVLAVKDFRALVDKLSKDFDAYRLAQEAQQTGN